MHIPLPEIFRPVNLVLSVKSIYQTTIIAFTADEFNHGPNHGCDEEDTAYDYCE
jgi:hypothetical protein